MHKSTIITLLLAFVSLTGQATTIERKIVPENTPSSG